MSHNGNPYRSSIPSRFVSRASVIRPHATQSDGYGPSRYVTVAEHYALLSWTYYLSVAQAIERRARSRLTHSSVTSFVGTNSKHGKHHSDVCSYSHTTVQDPDFVSRTPGFNTQPSFSNPFGPAFGPQSTFTTPQENSGSSGHIGPYGSIPLPSTFWPPRFAGAVHKKFSAAPGEDSTLDQPRHTMHDLFVSSERAVASYATPIHNQCGSHADVAMSTSDHPDVNHFFAAMNQHTSAACSVPDSGFRAQAPGPVPPSAGIGDPALFNSNLIHPTASSSQEWTDSVGATAFSPTSSHTSTSTQVAPLAQNHPTFICYVDGCGFRVFVDLPTLRDHLAVFHGCPTPQSGQPWKCRWSGCVCKLTACKGHMQGTHGAHVVDLAKHIWEHHLNFQDACPKCGEVGWVPGYSKNRHEKKCAGRKPARCRTCCVLFDSEAALAGHLALDRCPRRAGAVASS
jgi:hypothetical protein